MNWPATLPCPRFEPYQVSPREAVLEIDWGFTVRRRQIYADAQQEVSLELVVSGSQETDLRSFYEDDLEQGSLAFDMPLEIEGSFQTKSVRFIGSPPVYTPVSMGYAKVSATLLVSV